MSNAALFIMSRYRTNLGTGQKLDTSVPDQIPDYRGNLGEHLLNKRGLRTLGREGWGQKDRFLAAGSLLPLPQRSRCPPRFSPVVLCDDKGNA